MDPSLAIQKTIRTRLTGSEAVTMLVPADAIIDAHDRPEASACIQIGEGQADLPDDYETFFATAYADLHIWVREPGLTTAKSIAGAIHSALKARPWSVEAFTCHALTVTGTRFFRDPSGEHSHGIVTVQAVLQELPS
jgi:hypothetical protein